MYVPCTVLTVFLHGFHLFLILKLQNLILPNYFLSKGTVMITETEASEPVNQHY